MNRPSLLANPIMGLTSDRSCVTELLALHRHVYFSDLRAVTTAGLTLTGRLFYGCWVTPETFAGAKLMDAAFVCCAGIGEPPSDAGLRHAIADGGRGDWERMLAMLRQPETLDPDLAEHLVAVAAIATMDSHMEVRLSAMTLVARLLHTHPELLSVDTRKVMGAFLLYRAADESDMVYYDAVALVDELELTRDVLEHLVGRARSPDPRERVAALVARERLSLGVRSIELPDPPVTKLLDDPDPEVQLALLEFLGQNVRNSFDAKGMLPGVDLAAKLNPFLRSRDDRVRRAAIHYARNVGGSANREALIEALLDPDETLRNVAFEALYLRLQADELQDLLLHHEATPAQRAIVLEHETRWRESEPGFSRVADPAALRDLLASDDPGRRRDALLLAGFTGDPALRPDIEASLGDADPGVRAAAEAWFGRESPGIRSAAPSGLPAVAGERSGDSSGGSSE